MVLSSQSRGEGPSLVILHGLFGSGDNWQAPARSFAASFHVVTMDLRNHGKSGHELTMTYREMADDVIQTMDESGIDTAHLIGHSMGGKVAMVAALRYQERINSLTVVDISPMPYPSHHQTILAGMRHMAQVGPRSRQEADTALSVGIDDPAVRAFLLKSARADVSGVFRWTLNLDAIVSRYEDIADWSEPPGRFDGPVLLVRGAASDYVADGDMERVREFFPASTLTTVPDAGHWVHAEQRELFCELVSDFLIKGNLP